MGVRFTHATPDEVVAELTIGPQHRQPYGIVHGGVHAGLVEAVASAGAAVTALPLGRYPVGLENHTSFTRAVRDGVLRATGRSIVRGRQSHVWEVDVVDDHDHKVATGRVRLLILEKAVALGDDQLLSEQITAFSRGPEK